jgi:hypothetical protein
MAVTAESIGSIERLAESWRRSLLAENPMNPLRPPPIAQG